MFEAVPSPDVAVWQPIYYPEFQSVPPLMLAPHRREIRRINVVAMSVSGDTWTSWIGFEIVHIMSQQPSPQQFLKLREVARPP